MGESISEPMTDDSEKLNQDAVDELFRESAQAAKNTEKKREAEQAEKAEQEEKAEQKEQSERRQFERHGYRTLQLFAPCYDDTMPTPQSVQPVLCVDLSTAGIAFMWPDEPKFEWGMIRLGKPPTFTILKVCVRHVQQVGDEYRVGCQFVDRLGGPD